MRIVMDTSCQVNRVWTEQEEHSIEGFRTLWSAKSGFSQRLDTQDKLENENGHDKFIKLKSSLNIMEFCDCSWTSTIQIDLPVE